MLTSLINLGEQLSLNQNEWADVIDIPKIDSKKENLVARLIFNLDEKTIKAERTGQYQAKSPFTHKNIKIKDRNGKYTYVCCEADNVVKIEKTFFGKINNNGKEPTEGEFKERIDNKYPDLKTTDLYSLFIPLFELRSKFLNEKWGGPDTVNKDLLGDDYKKPGNRSKIVLIYTCVIAKELGIENATPIYELNGFEEFIRLDRLTKSTSDIPKISYATGVIKRNVIGVEFSTRYSFNYMFVKETLNYASQFNKDNFPKNYQVNSDEQSYLERASKYLLENQKVSIANISHCIIPQFLNNTKVDYEVVLQKAYKKSDLLFQSKIFSDTITSISDEIDSSDIYWINFLAFKSDGNSFKTTNLIKDVSITHFETVIKTIKNVDRSFRKMVYAVDWENVMSDKEKVLREFNFYTLYQIIPQREGKENKNEALNIFKSILEKRQIDKEILFKHFVDLVLCYYYKRYDGYKNVKRFGDDYFDFAIRDAVFKYLAFFYFLKQLNLIKNMEDNQQSNIEVIEQSETQIDQLEAFFVDNKLKANQKALFYLGQALDKIAYAQVLKDHPSKPILNKINYNGMSKENILKLHADLSEKITQYIEIVKNGKTYSIQRWTEPILKKFRENFAIPISNDNPKLSQHENVFYLLLGYSFGNKAKETNK